jgi:hypothetical protein
MLDLINNIPTRSLRSKQGLASYAYISKLKIAKKQTALNKTSSVSNASARFESTENKTAQGGIKAAMAKPKDLASLMPARTDDPPFA